MEDTRPLLSGDDEEREETPRPAAAAAAAPEVMTASWLIQDPEERIKKQDEEIRHLRGKIKGYETLGTLYQEKMKEVTQLKSKLSSITSEAPSIRMPSSMASIKTEAAGNFEETPIVPGLEKHSEDKENRETAEKSMTSDVPNTSQNTSMKDDQLPSLPNSENGQTEKILQEPLSIPDQTGEEVLQQPRSLPGETEEILSRSPPSPPRTTASSLSYKFINSDGETVSGSLEGRRNDYQMINFTGDRNQSAVEPQREDLLGETVQSLSRESSRVDSNAELSLNTREELSRLILGGDIDGDMIKYMLKSAKLEKRCKAKQALLDSVIVENQKIKAEMAKREAENIKLRQEILAITEHIRKKDLAAETRREELPSDWVRVEKDKRQQTAPGVKTVETTSKEAELRRKVDRLKQHAQELLKANTSWDNYCKRLKEEFEQKVETLRAHLHRSQQQGEALQQREQKRQGEVDLMVQALNKRADKAEKSRDSAVRELEEETLRRQENEQQRDIHKQRADLLEEQLTEQREIVQALTEERRSMMTIHQGSGTGADSTEIQVLKQQVTIYKDDFDNERRDRERAQAEKATLSDRLDEVKEELRVTKDQMRQKQLEMGRIHDEKKDYQRRLREVNQELIRVQNVLTQQTSSNPPYNPAHNQTTRISYPPQQPPPPYETSAISQGERKWSCRTCTYENHGLRVACEMCGARKQKSSDVPLSVVQMENPGQCHHRFTAHGNAGGQGFDQCDSPTSERPARGDVTTSTRAQYQRYIADNRDDIDFDATDEKS